MDSSKKTTVKLSRKIDLRGVYMDEYNTSINTNMLYYQHSFVYTKREFSKTKALDLSFLFVLFSRWINSNKFALIHLRWNMKNILTLSIKVRLKVTRVLCILISRVID